jgi:pimeloyl-ACP methyl ester carboxylesterase
VSAPKEVRFASFAGRRIAYALAGEGPPLVAPAWWVSHLELDWSDPKFRSFWEALGSGYTLARYDRPGVGLSDREPEADALTLDDEVALLRAVLDEVGWERAVLMGGSSGGCTAIAFAARFPERVDRLLLYGAYADGRLIATEEVREAIINAVRSHWGLGSRLLADIFLGDVGNAEHRGLRDSSAPRRAPRPRQRCWRPSTDMTSGLIWSGSRYRRWSYIDVRTARFRIR